MAYDQHCEIFRFAFVGFGRIGAGNETTKMLAPSSPRA
jgi:hypothetical protein